jgi:hypothetical protein
VSAKARLPLVPDQRGARAAASAGPAQMQACVVRAASGRVLLCVVDESAGEAAARFASRVLERIRAHGGPGCASLASEARLEALLTVRVGVHAPRARGGECDLEVARDEGLIATLIGDWIGTHIQDVSAKGCAIPMKSPRA